MTIRTPIVTNQTKIEIDLCRVQLLLAFLKEELQVAPSTKVDVTFVDEICMASLHERFLGLPGPTDVLSFPASAFTHRQPDFEVLGQDFFLGDIVVCPEYIRQNSDSLSGSLDLTGSIVHAMLHLTGYRHDTGHAERAMTKRFQEILYALGSHFFVPIKYQLVFCDIPRKNDNEINGFFFS